MGFGAQVDLKRSELEALPTAFPSLRPYPPLLSPRDTRQHSGSTRGTLSRRICHTTTRSHCEDRSPSVRSSISSLARSSLQLACASSHRTHQPVARSSSSPLVPTLDLAHPFELLGSPVRQKMDLDSAPPPLLLAPLLQDLHAWLSSPTLSSAPLATPTPSNQTPSGTAAAAIRASSALFNLLPASRGTTPPLPPTGSPTPAAGGNGPKGEDDQGKEETKKKKVKCRCVEAYGNNLYIGTSDGQVLWYTFSPVGSSSVS